MSATGLAGLLLDGHLPPERRDTWESFRDEATEGGADFLEIKLAALPRLVGREFVTGGPTAYEGGEIVAESYRLCDLAAALALEAAGVDGKDETLVDLYFKGDHEERRMILKALAFLTPGDATQRLLEEAHRTNEADVFLAGFADSDLPARVLGDEDFARGVLKSAFIDLPLERLRGAARRATPELSRMLLDFMSEREAAHRPVWAGSLELAARAACPGVRERVLGDLWSGVDARRLAAIRAAALLRDPTLRGALEERLAFEREPGLREALRSASATLAS